MGMILEAALISLVLSLDAFVASFAYGSKGIKIPFRSSLVIALTCAGTTGLALLVGTLARQYIPYGLAGGISFAILFILGIAKLADSITKSIIRRQTINKQIKFSLLNIRFILMLYADPENADVDGSKTLSTTEAAWLATALSLDGLAVGLGAALGSASGYMIFFLTIISGLAAITLGDFLGNKAAERININLSWLGGVLLILLALGSV